MPSFKKILVAVDLTEQTPFIAQESANFAKNSLASVILLHCIPALSQLPSEYMPQENIAVFMEESIASAKEQLQQLQQRFFQDLSVQIEIVVGEPVEEINTATMKYNCNLVIIGGSSKSTLEKLFLGSVASKIIASSPKSVLLLR